MSDFLRGDDDEVASFFAFQDVITAVLGILILIALQLSFSINALKGDGGSEDAEVDSQIITEQEFIVKRKERVEMERRLSLLRAKNREILAQKEAIESAGESLQGAEESVRILISEIEQMELDLGVLDQTLTDKRETLRRDASKLGLLSVQSEIAELTEESDKDSIIISDLKKDIEKLSNSLSSSLDELSEEKKRKDSVWMIPEKDSDGKDPLLITIDGKRMRFEEFDKPESLRVLNTSSLTSSFEAGVEKYDKRKFKIVFLFKPSGAIYFERVIELAKELGFEVGYDPVEERQKIIFSLPD
ncbi:MAG: hypothetical protein P8P49_11930 [Opitutales bacterium]|nr:hypothetical protein [Opitutales bacterium]